MPFAKRNVSFRKSSTWVPKRNLWLGVSVLAMVVLCAGCRSWFSGGSSGPSDPPSAGSAAVNIQIKGTDCPVRNVRLLSISVQNDATSGHRFLKYSAKVVCHTDSGDEPVKGATLTISVPKTPFHKDIGPTDADGNISGDTLSSGGLNGLPESIGQNGEQVDVTVVGSDDQKYAVQSVAIQYVK